MKAERFTAGSLWIERTRRREGPPVVYTVMIKESSRAFTEHKAILKFVKWPKGTPTGDALREWLASFEKEKPTANPELDVAKIKAEGFGPEAHDDKDPTANTKMIIQSASDNRIIARSKYHDAFCKSCLTSPLYQARKMYFNV